MSSVGAPHDNGTTLAAIRAQTAMVRSNALELEQLGLTLSGRDLSTVNHADLVSYLVWISLLTSHTARVVATWGSALIDYLDSTTSAPEPTSAAESTANLRPSADRPRRWWRRS